LTEKIEYLDCLLFRERFERGDIMIKNIFDAFNAIDEAINAGVENVVAFTRKVKDNGNSYSLKIDLPGFEKDEIEIDIIEDILNLKAKNAEDSKSFSFYIPSDINKEAVEASLKNGQLTITLPKIVKSTNTKKVRIT
jgi:HSP20 family protein